MIQALRRIAVSVAVVGFFGLALVSWLSGLEPLDCSIRAVVGAAALFVVVMIAGKLALSIIVSAIVQNSQPQSSLKDESGGPGR